MNQRYLKTIELIKQLGSISPQDLQAYLQQSKNISVLLSRFLTTEQIEQFRILFVEKLLLEAALQLNHIPQQTHDLLVENRISLLKEKTSAPFLSLILKQISPQIIYEVAHKLQAEGILTLEEFTFTMQHISSLQPTLRETSENTEATEFTSRDDFHYLRQLLGKKEITQLGPYEIQEEIGSGGMGKVYKAYHRELDRTVAIKIMQTLGNIASGRKRFLKEAKLTASLKHPGIVAIHDLGSEGDVDYIVMDFLEGETLGSYLRRSKLGLRKSLQIIQQAAIAIEYAHQNQVIHRDLKPANLMLEKKSGRVIVMDFGLAKHTDVSSDITGSAILGTPRYMAPEQAQGDNNNVSTLVDIYALGIILYEMLTGVPAIEGSNPTNIMYNIILGEVLPPRAHNPKISLELEAICLKAIAKEPQQRYQRAKEMAKDIERFMEGKKVLAQPLGKGHLLAKKLKQYRYALLLIFVVTISIFVGVKIGGKKQSVKKQTFGNKQNVKKQTFDNKNWIHIKIPEFYISYQVKKEWKANTILNYTAQRSFTYSEDLSFIKFGFFRTGKKNPTTIKKIAQSTYRDFGVYKHIESKGFILHGVKGELAKFLVFREKKKFQSEIFYTIVKNFVYTITWMAKKEVKPFIKARNSFKIDSHSILKNSTWKTIREPKFNVSYSMYQTWIKSILISKPARTVVEYYRSGGAFVHFHFFLSSEKSLHKIFLREEKNTLANAYDYKRLSTENYRIGDLNGIMCKYQLIERENNFRNYGEFFFTLHGNLFIKMLYVVPEEENRENNTYHDMFQQIIKSLRVGKTSQNFTWKQEQEPKYKVFYKVYSSWKREKFSISVERISRYWRTSQAYIQFDFFINVSKDTQKVIFSTQENILGSYRHRKRISSKKHTINGFKGILYTYELAYYQGGKSFFGEGFYGRKGSTFYVVLYVVPKQADNSYRQMFRTSMNSLRANK